MSWSDLHFLSLSFSNPSSVYTSVSLVNLSLRRSVHVFPEPRWIVCISMSRFLLVSPLCSNFWSPWVSGLFLFCALSFSLYSAWFRCQLFYCLHLDFLIPALVKKFLFCFVLYLHENHNIDFGKKTWYCVKIPVSVATNMAGNWPDGVHQNIQWFKTYRCWTAVLKCELLIWCKLKRTHGVQKR